MTYETHTIWRDEYGRALTVLTDEENNPSIQFHIGTDQGIPRAVGLSHRAVVQLRDALASATELCSSLAAARCECGAPVAVDGTACHHCAIEDQRLARRTIRALNGMVS